MKRRLILFTHSLLIYLALAACTSSSSTEQKTNAEEVYPSEEKKDTSRKGNVHIIEIRQMKFHPAEIRVHKGDEVRWVNKDVTDHDVTEQSSKAWASSPLSSGQSWSMIVSETTNYYCNLHVVMKGKIIVE